MSPLMLLLFVVGYFLVLMVVSYLTSKRSDNETFFIANRNSKWYLVAFGMIGTTLSGITFISVPGAVGKTQFGYFQFILGNAVGFMIVALLLMPLYYRMRLTSIYSYLGERFGTVSQRTGSFIFLLSRTIGSAARLYLVAIVLQQFIFNTFRVPFALTVCICLLFIWSYTFKGGLKTIIWTDTLQTVFLVASVVLSIYFVASSLHIDLLKLPAAVAKSGYAGMFFLDDFWGSKSHFLKQFFGGIFVTIAIVGLDQDLMQKNLSCRNIREAQKNMFTFTAVFVCINLFFLCVGALLYMFAQQNGMAIPAKSDYLYPGIALNHLGITAAIVFMLGLTAATFATTDSALTALTTSFCVDFLGFDKKPASPSLVKTRHWVHIVFSVMILIINLILNAFNKDAIVNTIFLIAGYTYGPLLGLYAFGLFTTRKVKDAWVPLICLAAPTLCYFINLFSKQLLGGYAFGNELIIVNAGLTCLGLYGISSDPGCLPEKTKNVLFNVK